MVIHTIRVEMMDVSVDMMAIDAQLKRGNVKMEKIYFYKSTAQLTFCETWGCNRKKNVT